MEDGSDNQEIDVYGYVITRGEYKSIIKHVHDNTVPKQCESQQNSESQYCKVYDLLHMIKLNQEYQDRDYYNWKPETRTYY
jgi:hypothetical protein